MNLRYDFRWMAFKTYHQIHKCIVIQIENQGEKTCTYLRNWTNNYNKYAQERNGQAELEQYEVKFEKLSS